MTVSDFLIRWLAEYAEHRVCGLTFESYERIVRRHLIPALGEQDLAELTSAQIQSYLHEKRCRGRLDGGGFSACTVAQHHRVLHKALVCAVKPFIEPALPLIEKRMVTLPACISRVGLPVTTWKAMGW